MYLKVFVSFIILIAIAIGVLTLILSRDQLIQLIMLRDTFEITLPILAFGSLIKYLCTFRSKN